MIRFSVTGTHCASCEIAIERELSKVKGVLKVEAEKNANFVTVTLADGVKLSADDCTKLFKEQGYEFFVSSMPRSLNLGKKRFWAVILILTFYLILTNTGWLNLAPNDAQGKGLLAVFGVGLVAAFSSCTAVVV